MNKSVRRKGVLPYNIISAAVHGESIAMHTVLQYYSGYIATLSTRTTYDKDGCPYSHVDEDIRCRLERKLLIAVLSFNLD